jgi:hypothetical protein
LKLVPALVQQLLLDVFPGRDVVACSLGCGGADPVAHLQGSGDVLGIGRDRRVEPGVGANPDTDTD